MRQPLRKADPPEQCLGLAPGVGAPDAADHLRQHDILDGREFRQQVMKLIDKAERTAPQHRSVLIGEGAAIAPLDQNGAAARALQQPRHMQHRRFAGPRRPNQRDDFAGRKHEVDAVQHRKLDATLAKHLAHAAQFERRRTVAHS